ncbi:MAG TPA: SOS response-associated peptidase [Spirochaetota bacterium]|nr:SOS response-associated peptidase [Spirochaetota bacterium]
MCGRFAQAIPLGKMKMVNLFDEIDSDYIENFNVAPSHYVSVVSIKEGKRVLSRKKWGLVPSWSRDDKMGSRLINARGETLKDKPSFRKAFIYRRCIVPVTGFYEWRKEGKSRKPFFIKMKGDTGTVPMLLAGLHESWNAPDGVELETFTVITTSSCEKIRSIHDRMPVIITGGDVDTWLNFNLPVEEAERLIKPVEDELIDFYPVSETVNSPRNNSEKCMERI